MKKECSNCGYLDEGKYCSNCSSLIAELCIKHNFLSEALFAVLDTPIKVIRTIRLFLTRPITFYNVLIVNKQYLLAESKILSPLKFYAGSLFLFGYLVPRSTTMIVKNESALLVNLLGEIMVFLTGFFLQLVLIGGWTHLLCKLLGGKARFGQFLRLLCYHAGIFFLAYAYMEAKLPHVPLDFPKVSQSILLVVKFSSFFYLGLCIHAAHQIRAEVSLFTAFFSEFLFSFLTDFVGFQAMLARQSF